MTSTRPGCMNPSADRSTRVKCLHVLVAHALAAGPGVNPLGDEALAAVPSWWTTNPCSQEEP